MADKKIEASNNTEKKPPDTGAGRSLQGGEEKKAGFLASLQNSPFGQIILMPVNLIALFFKGLKGFLGIKTVEKDPFLLSKLQTDRPFGLETPPMESITNPVQPETIREATPANPGNKPNLISPTATALGHEIAESYKKPPAEELFDVSDKAALFTKIMNTNQQQQTTPKRQQGNQIG